MFTKKSNVDINKLTAKLQDHKKDSSSRLRHLRTILDIVDHDGAKSLFETNYSHVYYILYDTFIQAEANLKQKVHKAHREELDGSLWLLEKILCLLPELLARRWQCHSISRIMAKLLHLGNSPKLRREGVRFFLLWYQTLADNAPMYVHAMYADLIPGLIVPQKGIVGPDTEFSASDFLNHPNMKVDPGSTAVFHETYSHPVQNAELTALLPPSSSEKTAPPDPRDGLEILLNSMVQTVACLRWRDNRSQKDQKAFAFLLQRFKDVFLPVFCPNFDFTMSIYEPKLELPVMRSVNKKEEVMASCVVVLINWISRFTHERLLNHRLDSVHIVDEVDHTRYLAYQQGLIVRDVFYATRENVNFIHEVYRQAFLLNFTSKPQIDAIRTAIAVYRDWMTGTTPPLFLLEPDDTSAPPVAQHNHAPTGTPRSQRLRTPSYVGAVSKENLAVRAGLQNVLQIFVTNAANVFLVNTSSLNIYFPTKSREARSTPLHEQTEVCKKVLNVYRTMVMNTHMEPKTWEQLLLVLLQVTAIVLHQNPTSGSKSASLGGILAQAIFQTLIVTWIRAHTNVPVNVQLWEKFLNVLASLTYRDELISEWDKTIQTLTRVFSRYVYGLNLQDLPLDRLAESKGKRRRTGGNAWQQPSTTVSTRELQQAQYVSEQQPPSIERESISSRSDEQSCTTQTNTSMQQQSAASACSNARRGHHSTAGITASITPLLMRSYSDGSMASAARSSRMRFRQRQKSTNAAVPPTTAATAPAHATQNVDLSGSTEHLPMRRLTSDLRRAMSLDSIGPSSLAAQSRRRRRKQRLSQATNDMDFDDEFDGTEDTGSRSPSPTASSGIEGGSIKDAQMQLDVLNVDSGGGGVGSLEDSGSGGVSGSGSFSGSYAGSQRRSIILGGNAKGWLPDSTAIMWKRMLGALGDVNRIPKAELHAQVFKHLLDMTTNLIKIKQNQGISTDNQSTPAPPALVPPIGIVAPWCYGALELDKSFKRGKLWSVQLLCTLAVHGAVSGMNHLPVFYTALHRILTGEDRELMYAVLRHVEGPRFLSLLLPGHTLLLLDIVHASAILLTSLEANRVTPRAEVAALLGSLLCYPVTLLPKPMLQPTPQIFELLECPDLQDHILNILLRCARREPAAKARCIALAQLGQWILLQLSHPISNNSPTHSRGALQFQQKVPHPTGASPRTSNASVVTYHPRIREALQVLLQALQFKHRTIAIIAIDALKLCAERGRELASIERMPQLIITAICRAIEIQSVTNPKDSDKVVLTSLMLCLGEFCMAFPASVLLEPLNDKGDTLVLNVLRVLLPAASGAPKHERVKLTADDDFDTHITSDDLQTDGKLPEANYQTSETIQVCITAIRLCAKAVAMHLVTHLGHFPMGIGASRLSSLVEEQDDVVGAVSSQSTNTGTLLSERRGSVELPSVLHAQNMQLFMLNQGLVASFIELPALKLPGGGVTAGLVTADKQVRVLMRDLNGKACWDASILYSEPRKNVLSSESTNQDKTTASVPRCLMNVAQRQNLAGNPMDSMVSSMVGLDVLPHSRHTMRHRPEGVLPLAKDLAPDLDQLDDLLAYIGHTSPECLTYPSARLNAPGPSPLGSNLEAQTISIILNQRVLEQEFIANLNQQALQYTHNCSSLASSHHDQRSTSSVEPISHASFESYNTTSLSGRTEIPFQYCRLLFSHLGLAGWERRSRTHLLQRSEKLLRELRNVDQQKCRETHKMAVIYVGSGQEDKNSILRNSSGSSMYEMFVSALGWEIDLETHSGFLGGLPRQGCGATAPYYATPFLEVIYHVATRMPGDSPEAILLKTRHLGNDEVHIVWSEHYRDYRRDILPTEFCDVLIVVYPLKNGLFRVTVNRKPDVPWFGPLANESVVSGACLATLVRATAINAGRAKRAALSMYQQYYEERNRLLDTVSSRYKESTTFEDFAHRIYNPIPNLSYGTLQSTTSVSAAPLAAALIDQQHQRSSIKGWVQASIDSNMRDIPLGITTSASATSAATMEAAHNSSSPRGARKFGSQFKNATSFPKKTTLQSNHHTPPESPTMPLRRFK